MKKIYTATFTGYSADASYYINGDDTGYDYDNLIEDGLGDKLKENANTVIDEMRAEYGPSAYIADCSETSFFDTPDYGSQLKGDCIEYTIVYDPIETITNIDKVVRLGTVKTYGGRWASVYCHITYKNNRLSISGVVGPLPSGNCLGSCGQIDMDWTPIVNYAKGWTPSMVKRFLDIWDRWHLNDMRAGTPEQMDYIRNYRKNHARANYEELCSALKTAGLYEVVRADGTVYRYGHAWIFEPVPADVLQFLRSLPVSDKEPAWY